ncbi:lipoprotein [Pseudomonas sp. 250J]|uniref:hypothetical protein n=1 Tax=Pseudomonas TaxID=286 RepID=UPI00067FFC2C|nr:MULTISPECIES: hypothetical protein [Pseudomonas]KNX78366.1 lipoprotein [Pseudomonas sp. 250J]MCU7281037.1 hypothetical protein [Pseudomonas peradeniyensis]QZA52723.1 hypothetical protein K2O50_17065 [Pseudomonas sp. 2hn]
MKRLLALTLLTLAIAGCDKAEQTSAVSGQCAKDTDCKGERICESGQCVNPQPQAALLAKPAVTAPLAPSIAYAPLPISDEGAGPFSVQSMELGTALNYQSRAGVMNVMESIVADAEATGYVAIEKAYAFGPNRYVLVVSTGEGGNACPASTYVFSFDTSGEYVDGKAEVDGCSEMVESMAEGNKLTIKKDGAATVVYNGQVK